MIENLPIYISVVFELTTVTTLLLFYWTVKKSNFDLTSKKANLIFFGLVLWLTIQAILTINNVYNSGTTSNPPKLLLLGILPTISTIILLFATQTGRQFIDSLPLINITYLNIVRIPVELVLLNIENGVISPLSNKL